MWEADETILVGGRKRRFRLSRAGVSASWRAVIEAWLRDPEFQDFFVTLLAEVPYAAYFWETPPITQASLDRSFECVLIDSPFLAAVSPEPRAFVEHCKSGTERDGIALFPNLGGDALLVAPCPGSPEIDFAHLARFVRKASPFLSRALWRRVGEAMHRCVGPRPMWLSTAGTGVYWLHVRLDTTPKYYRHEPYRIGLEGSEQA